MNVGLFNIRERGDLNKDFLYEDLSGVPICMSHISYMFLGVVDQVCRIVLEYYLLKPGFRLSHLGVETSQLLGGHRKILWYLDEQIVSVILESELRNKEEGRLTKGEKRGVFISVYPGEGCEKDLWEKLTNYISERG